ncbi:MAG: sel1 repeat family protein [Gammaproteobacteria bacterium]|nr:sel1 repeat family protein [Gammaproteobacteria bacterium]MYF01610.1 sel1 repeat family protein [Gammaproteobacteria bacterium]MYI76307.1 sel1 repeat family protein [Gammaproteobacteria bacterium]
MTELTTHSYEEFLAIVFSEKNLDLSSVEVDLSESNLTVDAIAELDNFGRRVARLLDSPLRLGSIGSAVLDRLELSYAGHLAMFHYYKHLENEHASVHEAQLNRIVEYMTTERDGSLEKPYRALSPVDAVLFVQQSGYRVIGSIYVRTNVEPMVLQVMRIKGEGPFDEVFFDLSAIYPILLREFESRNVEASQAPLPLVLVNLANAGDSSAQLSLGRFLANGGATSRAESMYIAASRADNGYAHMLYGNLFLNRAFDPNESDAHRYLQVAQSHYSQAIDYGYHTALRQLGWLLHRGYFGNSRRSDGMEMLERAASFDDALALRYLGDVYRRGNPEQVDLQRAARFYERAAETGDRMARIEYYRVVAHPDSGLAVSKKLVDWLLDSAANDDVLAMLELGNCYVRGCAQKPNYRKASRWYRKAVETAPEDPEIVNTVAWTLAVTDKRRLRNPEYALKIVNHLMENNEESRANPMIVDTWAAAHAALGDFVRAVQLQREALELAIGDERFSDWIDEIESHLDSFLNGEALSESIP